MGHWGWRPASILICVCVWITGCVDQHDVAPAATPTTVPQITLMLSTPPQFPAEDDPSLPVVITPRPASVSHFEATRAASNPFPAATPLPLNVSSPTCYESTPGGVVCLGLARNPNPFTVSDVTLLAHLYGQDGDLLRQTTITLDQRLIPPGQSAPYRLLFPPEDRLYLADDFGGILTGLRSAILVTDMDAYADIETELRDSGWEDGSYAVTLRLTNNEEETVNRARLVATLTDRRGRVAGYRVIEPPSLKAGEVTTLTFAIDSQLTGQPMTVTLHVEALR